MSSSAYRLQLTSATTGSASDVTVSGGGLDAALGGMQVLNAGTDTVLMMTLIALAITVAFVFSLAVTLGYPGMPLWGELATLVTIMLLGHWIEMRSISQAQGP